MSVKTCLTCDAKIPLEPTYKTQCLFCYQNNYRVCYNCKQPKRNSYSLCFDCHKLDKHDRLDRYESVIKESVITNNTICQLCSRNGRITETFHGQKYCFICYTDSLQRADQLKK